MKLLPSSVSVQRRVDWGGGCSSSRIYQSGGGSADLPGEPGWSAVFDSPAATPPPHGSFPSTPDSAKMYDRRIFDEWIVGSKGS